MTREEQAAALGREPALPVEGFAGGDGFTKHEVAALVAFAVLVHRSALLPVDHAERRKQFRRFSLAAHEMADEFFLACAEWGEPE